MLSISLDPKSPTECSHFASVSWFKCELSLPQTQRLGCLVLSWWYSFGRLYNHVDVGSQGERLRVIGHLSFLLKFSESWLVLWCNQSLQESFTIKCHICLSCRQGRYTLKLCALINSLSCFFLDILPQKCGKLLTEFVFRIQACSSAMPFPDCMFSSCSSEQPPDSLTTMGPWSIGWVTLAGEGGSSNRMLHSYLLLHLSWLSKTIIQELWRTYPESHGQRLTLSKVAETSWGHGKAPSPSCVMETALFVLASLVACLCVLHRVHHPFTF